MMKFRQFSKEELTQDLLDETERLFTRTEMNKLSNNTDDLILMVAQWSNMGLPNATCKECVSFELILISDGLKSIVAYNYLDVNFPEVCLDADGALEDVESGYNIDNDGNSVKRFSESGTAEVADFTNKQFIGFEGGPDGVKGLRIIEAFTKDVISKGLQVLHWAKEQEDNTNRNFSVCSLPDLEPELPNCPCFVDVDSAGNALESDLTNRFEIFERAERLLLSKVVVSRPFVTRDNGPVVLLCRRFCAYTEGGSQDPNRQKNMISCENYGYTAFDYFYNTDIDIFNICKEDRYQRLCYDENVFTLCRPDDEDVCINQADIAAEATGDPHMNTLDLLEYSFNGLGEYLYAEFEISSTKCTIYARTERAVKTVNGQTEPGVATVFVGFSLECTGTPRFLVLKNGTAMQLKSCDTTSCSDVQGFLQFSNYTEFSSALHYTITKFNNNDVRITLGDRADVSLRVRLQSVGFLLPTIRIDRRYRGLVKGLMGNYDGNANNDLIPKGNTTAEAIAVNSTERVIYERFGQSWLVPAGTQPFRPFTVSFDSSFEPLFFEDINWSGSTVTEAQAVATCGDSRQCIFDVFVTADPAFGAATKSTQDELKRLRIEEANTPPKFIGNIQNVYQATAGMQLRFVINATTTNEFPVVLSLANPPAGSSYIDTVFLWNVTYDPSFNGDLKFVAATNPGNATWEKATERIVSVMVCNCQNGGECNFAVPRTNSSTGAQIATCRCGDKWEGIFCETDLNGCADNPCVSDGSGCVDVPAANDTGVHHNCTACDPNEELKSTSVSDLFQCKAIRICSSLTWGPPGCNNTCGCQEGVCNETVGCVCPPGYNGTFCEFDRDECLEGTSTCEPNSKCFNTPGSFTCLCNPGFKKNTSDLCEDIDECKKYRPCDKVNGICTNLPGNFTCSCKPGFNGNGVVCQTVSVNECVLGTPCDANAICTDTPDSFTCACKEGFTGDGTTCKNVNECTNTPCHPNATCTDTIGSFTCDCNAGFGGNGTSCFPTSCDPVCDANGICNETAKTCSCNSGFAGTGTKGNCININECQETGAFKHDCDANAKCDDTIGSFTCTCNPGYAGNGKSCADENECARNPNPCMGTTASCTNSVGSFICSCEPGFELITTTMCIDIDECARNIDTCNTNTSTCSNLVDRRRFQCLCKSGYKRGSTIQECILDSTEVPCNPANLSPCLVSDLTATCSANTAGNNVCGCPDNFQRNRDGLCVINNGTQTAFQGRCTITGLSVSTTNSTQIANEVVNAGYSDMPGFINATTQDLNDGSLIVDYVVNVDRDLDPAEYRRVALHFYNKLEASNNTINGQTVDRDTLLIRRQSDPSQFVLVKTLKEQPCVEYRCENGASCTIASGTGAPSCLCLEGFQGAFCETPVDPTTGLSGGIIAIIVVVVIVGVILIIIAIIAIVTTLKKREKYGPNNVFVREGGSVDGSEGAYQPRILGFHRSGLWQETDSGNDNYGEIYEEAGGYGGVGGDAP